MIKLTLLNGLDYYVNPDFVASFFEAPSGRSYISMNGEPEPTLVKQSAEEIEQRIFNFKATRLNPNA